MRFRRLSLLCEVYDTYLTIDSGFNKEEPKWWVYFYSYCYWCCCSARSASRYRRCSSSCWWPCCSLPVWVVDAGGRAAGDVSVALIREGPVVRRGLFIARRTSPVGALSCARPRDVSAFLRKGRCAK